MLRGISFEIPNKYGSFLGDILKNVDITKYNWRIGAEESYLVADGQLGELLFPEDINELDGMLLKSIIEDNQYYLIFANLKAFPKGKNVSDIELYEEFTISECQLVLLIVDCTYTEIYCKDKKILECLFQNAKDFGFKNVEYITDENDGRTRLSV